MRTILSNFTQHVADVGRLIEFDREVMHLAISAVEDLHRNLVQKNKIENEQINGARTLQILKGIRDHGSLKPRYSLILNQAIVLLVSYFGSSVEDIFSSALTSAVRAGRSTRLMKEEMKITVGELIDLTANTDDALASLFIEKKDLSFQDMQAIHRAFRDYVGVELERDQTVNNIILAQACRHVIVHAGGEVTTRLVRQVSGANPRTLKTDIHNEQTIQFSVDEVQTVADSMNKYLTTLVQKTEHVVQNCG